MPIEGFVSIGEVKRAYDSGVRVGFVCGAFAFILPMAFVMIAEAMGWL